MKRHSLALYEKACRVMPGGVSSPARAFYKVGIPPLVVASATGDLIYDVDGHCYIDYCGAWGALILGHSHPEVVSSACIQASKGTAFGFLSEAEESLASQIVRMVPSVEKVRFTASGTEANLTAIKLARWTTEREAILVFQGSYHGHAESLMAPSKGLKAIPFNDFDALRAAFAEEKIAAILVEPIPGNMGVIPPCEGFLQALREEATKAGALLIFDEVITGFRVGPSGAQGLYGVDPDLTCFGKIISGGFPAAALGGKAQWMDLLAPLGPVYHAGTMSGHPVAMRAGEKTLSLLQEVDFYERLEEKANRLIKPIRKKLEGRNACFQNIGSMGTLFFGAKEVRDCAAPLDEALFKQFFQAMFEKGILIPPLMREAWFISSAHTEEHLDFTAQAVLSFLEAHLPLNEDAELLTETLQ